MKGDDGDQERREYADLPHSSHEDRALRGPTTPVAIDEYRAHARPGGGAVSRRHLANARLHGRVLGCCSRKQLSDQLAAEVMEFDDAVGRLIHLLANLSKADVPLEWITFLEEAMPVSLRQMDRKVITPLMLLLLVAAFAHNLFHEFGHWLVGTLLGNPMSMSLNFAWPTRGQYLEEWHSPAVSS